MTGGASALPIITTTIFLCYSSAPTMAQNVELMKKRLNNLSHEMSTCFVYYTIAGQCVGERDNLGKKLIEMGQTALKYSIETGRIAGVSAKAIEARSSISIDEMKSDIDNSCTNISVINYKYGKSCKASMEGYDKKLVQIADEAERGSRGR